jgi:NADH:ubiquinone oxidoreductase subunit E
MQEKNEIMICLGSSCFSRGNQETLTVIKSYIQEKQLSVNLTFKGKLCSGLCNEGPIVVINGEIFKEVSPDRIIAIL